MLILTLILIGQEKRYFFGMGAPLAVEDLVRHMNRKMPRARLTQIDQNHTARWWNAMYALTNIADKFSFGFFLLRTSHPKNQIQRGLTIGSCLLMGAWGLVYFALSFTCAISYDPDSLFAHDNNHCKLNTVFTWSGVAISALAIVVDAAFGVVFIWLIASCKLNRRAKVLTCLTIIVGSLSGISSLGRIITIRSTQRFTDPLVQVSAVRFWSIMEVGICLAAPCVGSIQSFLTPYMDHPNPLGYQDPNSSRLNFGKKQTTSSSVDEKLPGPIPTLMQADVERGVVVKVVDETKKKSKQQGSGSSDAAKKPSRWNPIGALLPTR